jgi:phospholipid/cholesterol/gamma-HCH transport system ATP-binding protein
MTSPSATAAVELRDLHKNFGSQQVLRGISLRVNQGETLAVLGRSGTGKSVLLKLLIGLQQPDSGSICLHGREITQLSRTDLNAVRAKVGFLFQEGALYDSLTVEDNVAFPLLHHDGVGAGEHGDRVAALLRFVGMEGDGGKMPSEISGGMKKRVGLARALALEPDILLFDEPTAGLDPITAGEIEDLIRTLRKEQHVASIIVTHDLHCARAIADRVALIQDGTIVIDGTFDELTHSTHPFVSQFLRAAS